MEDKLKKILAIITLGLMLVALPLLASQQRHKWFLSTAVNVAAGATVTYPATLPSGVVDVSKYSKCSFTVVFSRAAGAADTVDFTFDISYDGGTTWASFEGVTIQIATNHAVISGTTVRAYIEVNLYGISHIKLHSIKNNDGVNNITACNATLSI